MEKITNRDKYVHNFREFCDKVQLNKEFIDALSIHPYFKDDMKTVKNFTDETTQKVFILLEFTRLRSTCEEIIELLRNSGQTEAANKLNEYNTSSGPMEVTNNDVIPVTSGKEMKGSLYYSMSKNPRGKCVIINNVVEYSDGKLSENAGLYKESKRFQSIFTQLYFDVEPIDSTIGMTANDIREKLQKLSKDNSLVKPEALVVMIISHGRDEKVMGYNACQGKDYNDVIKISEIVDIFSEKKFSEKKCSAFENIPKLFFFNCCRSKKEVSKDGIHLSPNEMPVDFKVPNPEFTLNLTLKNNENRVFFKLNTIDQTWINANRDTFISYSCSEGNKAFYKKRLGISHFGQALSHSIAQYACEESLQSIMSRTCDFIDKYREFVSKSVPELRGQGLRRQLFFNPGFPRIN